MTYNSNHYFRLFSKFWCIQGIGLARLCLRLCRNFYSPYGIGIVVDVVLNLQWHISALSADPPGLFHLISKGTLNTYSSIGDIEYYLGSVEMCFHGTFNTNWCILLLFWQTIPINLANQPPPLIRTSIRTSIKFTNKFLVLFHPVKKL